MSLLDSIILWAKRNETLKVLLTTGSKASLQGGDAFSDDDIAVFGDDFSFITNDDWLQQIGPFALCIHDQFQAHGFDIPTRLVIFDRFVKVDFSFRPFAELEQMCATGKLPDEYNIGYRMLLDKAGIAKRLPLPTYSGFNIDRPSQEKFQNNTSEFFFEAWHVLKYLQRNELWAAMSRQWACMKWLLQLLEWQEGLKRGWKFNPKSDGKDMMQWLPKSLQQPLAECFPCFDRIDIERALRQSIELYRATAQKFSESIGFAYKEPTDLVRFARAMLK